MHAWLCAGEQAHSGCALGAPLGVRGQGPHCGQLLWAWPAGPSTPAIHSCPPHACMGQRLWAGVGRGQGTRGGEQRGAQECSLELRFDVINLYPQYCPQTSACQLCGVMVSMELLPTVAVEGSGDPGRTRLGIHTAGRTDLAFTEHLLCARCCDGGPPQPLCKPHSSPPFDQEDAEPRRPRELPMGWEVCVGGCPDLKGGYLCAPAVISAQGSRGEEAGLSCLGMPAPCWPVVDTGAPCWPVVETGAPCWPMADTSIPHWPVMGCPGSLLARSGYWGSLLAVAESGAPCWPT